MGGAGERGWRAGAASDAMVLSAQSSLPRLNRGSTAAAQRAIKRDAWRVGRRIAGRAVGVAGRRGGIRVGGGRREERAQDETGSLSEKAMPGAVRRVVGQAPPFQRPSRALLGPPLLERVWAEQQGTVFLGVAGGRVPSFGS